MSERRSRNDGQMHRNHVEAEVKILAERASAIFGLEVAVGGRDDADVDLDFLIAANRTNFLFLQNAQKLGLHFLG